MSHIRIRGASKRYDGADDLAVDGVDLDVADGELLVLVGPSGCGKSTLLRMIAGLEDVTEGSIAIGDRDVTHMAPKQRDIAMVFQSYALYPHMTVRRNIGYPLRLAKVADEEREARVEAMARSLHLEAVLDRRPAQLSGGQRQRVAMGRALVRRPQAFLMDEPLSNLDAKLRVEMRAEIARLQCDHGVTTVYVTHDQVEAMTMGDRVAVLDRGRLQQVGTPQSLYEAPASLFVATFLGSPAMNVLAGTIGADGVVALGSADAGGRPVTIGLRPEAFTDAALEPGVAGEWVFDASVDLVESLGSELIVHAILPGLGPVVARLPPKSRARRGDVLKLAVDAAQMHLFDPATGNRL